MTMQNTPLLLSRILGRGARLDPNEEVVTLQENGTHRQTLKTTWTAPTSSQAPSPTSASRSATASPASCGTTTVTLSFTRPFPPWARYCTP